VSDHIAIRVQDLHIRYRTVLDKKQTLRGIFSRKEREKRARNVRVVDAVRGVTFDVERGSVLGIVGHNGAGKSTLLRAIAGILPPEQGRIEVAGKVSTLLALGLGFNHALSGRENIAIGGLAAGLSRDEVREREEDIIAFAGIGDFIDMPMRTYSSGMKGRLAFAVSTAMSPDILLIDEALSAGDAAFKKKAADRMKQLCGEDRTIVLVSHGLGSIRELADTAMWMDHGRIVQLGPPDDVVSAYTKAASVGDDVVANED
jgi:teichoic acid transport system ATP-binding protein